MKNLYLFKITLLKYRIKGEYVMNQNNKSSKNSISKKNIIIVALIVTVIVSLTIFSNKDKDTTVINNKEVTAVIEGDLTITKADITDKAKFYSYLANDTYMEVIAVRASDGTVRTALNTCQVCNNSGRGYYVQKNDVLVCQNCGNQFTIDQVEKVRNGCNPVPLDQSIKTEDDAQVVINEEALLQYEPLFLVWKK